MNTNTIVIALLLAMICLAYVLIKINKKIRLKAYELFLKAEHNFVSGAGENKMNYVVENIYCYLPVPVRIFINEESLRKLVQKIFDEIKDLLDDGKRNGSVE